MSNPPSADDVFGDSDPEDAWDDDDPIETKIAILGRVVDALTRLDDLPEARRDDALRLLGKLEHRRTIINDRVDAVRDALEDL